MRERLVETKRGLVGMGVIKEDTGGGCKNVWNSLSTCMELPKNHTLNKEKETHLLVALSACGLMMGGDSWRIQTESHLISLKCHCPRTESYFDGFTAGAKEGLSRWLLSGGVDSLDTGDCFLGAKEMFSRDGLRPSHTGVRRPANENNHTTRHSFPPLILFVLPRRYRGESFWKYSLHIKLQWTKYENTESVYLGVLWKWPSRE